MKAVIVKQSFYLLNLLFLFLILIIRFLILILILFITYGAIAPTVLS